MIEKGSAEDPLSAGGRRKNRPKGIEVSNEDLELHVTDELLWDPKVDNARTLSEAVPAADREMRAQIDATSQAVAAVDQAYVMDEIGSVSWERRGLLQRLTRRPRPRAS
jgi:hypothetical protein